MENFRLKNIDSLFFDELEFVGSAFLSKFHLKNAYNRKSLMFDLARIEDDLRYLNITRFDSEPMDDLLRAIDNYQCVLVYDVTPIEPVFRVSYEDAKGVVQLVRNIDNWNLQKIVTSGSRDRSILTTQNQSPPPLKSSVINSAPDECKESGDSFYDELVVVQDGNGKAISGYPFFIEAEGKVFAGRTNSKGETIRIKTSDQSLFKIYFGDEALYKGINHAES